MASTTTTASISIVVVTRDRRAELLRTLDRMVERSGAPVPGDHARPRRPEVIVVDNGSSDGTAEAVAATHPWCRLIALQQNLGAAARTLGVRAADTELVAFADDDSWWGPGSLTRATEVFGAHPRLGLLAARVRLEPTGEPDPVCALMAASPFRPPPGVAVPGPAVLGFIACGAVVRRSSYLEVGGFHPKFGIGGEETLLALDLSAAGWGCAYVDEIVAHHDPSPSRDPKRRAAVVARNALWTDLLRRPLPVVLRHVRDLLRRATHDAGAASGLAMAAGGASGLWAERQMLPAWLEGQLRP